MDLYGGHVEWEEWEGFRDRNIIISLIYHEPNGTRRCYQKITDLRQEYERLHSIDITLMIRDILMRELEHDLDVNPPEIPHRFSFDLAQERVEDHFFRLWIGEAKLPTNSKVDWQKEGF